MDEGGGFELSLDDDCGVDWKGGTWTEWYSNAKKVGDDGGE